MVIEENVFVFKIYMYLFVMFEFVMESVKLCGLSLMMYMVMLYLMKDSVRFVGATFESSDTFIFDIIEELVGMFVFVCVLVEICFCIVVMV